MPFFETFYSAQSERKQDSTAYRQKENKQHMRQALVSVVDSKQSKRLLLKQAQEIRAAVLWLGIGAMFLRIFAFSYRYFDS
ncbi:hypothetical protein SDC9_144847 [bioreactor metagenome]|uniref:Uncharacterized protein n=1 Tax=bioreactor metagenome TaxID=1076179 RepID=A0A645E7F5_9ZZZZ